MKERYRTWVEERPERKKLYKSLLVIVLPIIIQNLLGSLVNSMDVLMLGMVGQDELAAVSLANQYMFLLWGFFFGLNSAASLMNSQYWGKGDKRAVQAVLGITFKISTAITILVSICCIFFPENLMGLYTNDAKMIEIGANYLRTIGISYTLMSFAQSYHCTLRSVGEAKKSTVFSTITLLLNVVLNAVFIFGLLGLPKMGVVGVAIATTLARLIELILCIFDYLRGSMFKADLSILLGHHALLMKDFVRYAGPALVNDLSWTVAFSTYSIVLGHLNTDIVAASSVSTTLRNLFTEACFGLATGGTVVIGMELGRNNLQKAKKDSKTILMVTMILGLIMGTAIVMLRHPLMGLFHLSARAFDYLNIMMIINGYYLLGQAFNTLMIAGIFRAGGNTKFGMICDTITMWCIAVPLAFISAFVLKLPPMLVYFIICLDEFWKVPVVIRYYKSDKWINNITRDIIV